MESYIELDTEELHKELDKDKGEQDPERLYSQMTEFSKQLSVAIGSLEENTEAEPFSEFDKELREQMQSIYERQLGLAIELESFPEPSKDTAAALEKLLGCAEEINADIEAISPKSAEIAERTKRLFSTEGYIMPKGNFLYSCEMTLLSAEIAKCEYQNANKLAKLLRKQAKALEAVLMPRQASEPIRHIQKGVSKLSDPSNWPGIIKSGGAALKVSGEKEAPRYTVVRVGNDEAEQEAISPFTGIGESVHNAIASLAVGDCWEFALTDVAKLVYGTRTTPSPKQLREVESSIDRMAITPITVDWSAEARNGELEFNGEKVTNFKHSATILAIEKISIRTKNGTIVKGYRLLSMPLIHRHDIETKQFTTVRRNMLEAAAVKVRSTEANIKTREYLLRRIARMKNASAKAKRSLPETNRNITYDRIMEAREVANDAKGKNKKAMKEAVRGYLEAFVEDGWIKGFNEYTAKADQKSRKKGGTKATGVTIAL